MNNFVSTIEQKKILETEGNVVVYASAGTGKTATLIEKIKRDVSAIKNHEIIAAITFTTKATQEIKDRLGVNVYGQHVSTNNTFTIEEIIKPFFCDVYKVKINREIKTSYDKCDATDSFESALERLKTDALIVTLKDREQNFIFQLALKIIKASTACQEYFTARYHKVYVDEYQDCDIDMCKFFMYLAEELGVPLFIVGDEKQAI